jgi:hypothetical protein
VAAGLDDGGVPDRRFHGRLALAMKHGSGFVRKLFLVVVSVLIVKTGYDAWFVAGDIVSRGTVKKGADRKRSAPFFNVSRGTIWRYFFA